MVGKINRIVSFALLALLASFVVAQAKEPIRTIEGLVTKVSDGDTINVIDSLGTKVKVRLYGIDAPETEKSNRRTGYISKPGQPYGDEAWESLEGKVSRKRVKLDVIDVDKYKRLVCLVWLGDRSINQEMVAEGWAWAYRKYLDRPHASEFIGFEAQARRSHLGVWQQANPQPPWEFRKLLKTR